MPLELEAVLCVAAALVFALVALVIVWLKGRKGE